MPAFPRSRTRRLLPRAIAVCFLLGSVVACGSSLRSAVSMRVERAPRSPKDASVYIDEEYVGPLYYVAAHGVRLPIGTHRVSVVADGYFPWDRQVESDRKPILLTVELVPVPE
jgi:hypothetical protein